jgi:hypothetical protein
MPLLFKVISEIIYPENGDWHITVGADFFYFKGLSTAAFAVFGISEFWLKKQIILKQN